MHPNSMFAWADSKEMLDFVRKVSFAHIFCETPDGPRVAHAPLIVTAGGSIRFHLAKANGLTAHLDGRTGLCSIMGPEGYVSPDWYGSSDQVPTWNYVAVEAVGSFRRLATSELVDSLDVLSENEEARLWPKAPWKRAKMRTGLFERMLKGIVGFEMAPSEIRGTRKLGQNKRVGEREGAIAGLLSSGNASLAEQMALIDVGDQSTLGA